MRAISGLRLGEGVSAMTVRHPGMFSGRLGRSAAPGSAQRSRELKPGLGSTVGGEGCPGQEGKKTKEPWEV